MKTPDQIISLYKQRKIAEGPARARAVEISRVYSGVVSVPLPELDSNSGAAVANLLTQGLDQMAMRISSVTPSVICPPLVEGQAGSEKRANVRRRAITAWWQENRFDRKLRKRSRWFIGYASAPVMLRPSPEREIPIWELRDPLCTYPAPMPEADDLCPSDCIFAVQRSLAWIAERYPNQARALAPVPTPNYDELFDVLEYVDADEHVMVVVGKQGTEPARNWGQPQVVRAGFAELNRFENRLGRCPVVIPSRLSLDRPQGQFDQMPALYEMQARAMALWLVATERSIFPDTWFISRPNETVEVIARPDGRRGVPGEVKGGDLKEVDVGPPPQVGQVIDLLERNQRVTASISSDFGGEAPTNVRTGKAGSQLMGETVDYWIQEAQQTFSASMVEENKLAIAIAREYFGDRPRSYFVGPNFTKKPGPVDYVPNRDFDTDANQVAWPYSGADAQNLVIALGQRVGTGIMSKRSAREKDPMIDDAEMEESRVTEESLKAALLSAIDQQVAGGQMQADQVAKIYQAVAEDKVSLFEAWNSVQKDMADAQQAQAAQQQGAPGGMPGMGGPPGGGMGLGAQQNLGLGPMNPPGTQPGSGGGGVAAPAPSVQHMQALLQALKSRGQTAAAQ